jgi:type II secretory pathway pseudopilin PulG
VVISIISLLSSVVLSSLSSARAKARDAKRLFEIKQIQTALQLYASNNDGNYPSTGSLHNVYMDPGCAPHNSGGDVVGTQQNWIPGLVPTYISILPKDPIGVSQVPGQTGFNACYMYSSDGTGYLLSAYGTVEGSSNGGKMDSNFGYREMFYNSNGQDQQCYNTINYSGFILIRRKSFTLTNLTPNDMHGCYTL